MSILPNSMNIPYLQDLTNIDYCLDSVSKLMTKKIYCGSNSQLHTINENNDKTSSFYLFESF